MTKLRSGAGFVVRLVARASLAVYFGGFTFYAAVVVPDLHDHLGGMETGEISRRVALILYTIGASALGLAWLTYITDRDQRAGLRGKIRAGFLTLASILFVVLVTMHRSLGIHLDSGGEIHAFRSSHERYLTVWTGEWLAILGLMAIDALAGVPKKAE